MAVNEDHEDREEVVGLAHEHEEELMEERLVTVLGKLSNHMDKDQEVASHSLLSIEKIVAGIVMLVVTTVCIWVGSSVTTLTKSVIELKSDVSHQSETVAELKTEVREFRTGQIQAATNNSREISLILERMKADDNREVTDATTFQDFERRLLVLERK